MCQCANNLLTCDKSACVTTTESAYTVTTEVSLFLLLLISTFTPITLLSVDEIFVV